MNIFPNDLRFHSKALNLSAIWKRDSDIYFLAKGGVVEGLNAKARGAYMDV
jgi:hypothetical protein